MTHSGGTPVRLGSHDRAILPRAARTIKRSRRRPRFSVCLARSMIDVPAGGLGGGPDLRWSEASRLTVDGRCGAGAAAATHARCESATDQRPFRRRACKPRAARLQRNPTLALSASGMLASANDWRFDATPAAATNAPEASAMPRSDVCIEARGAPLGHPEHAASCNTTPPPSSCRSGRSRRRRAQRPPTASHDVFGLDIRAGRSGSSPTSPRSSSASTPRPLRPSPRRPDRLAFYMGCCPHRREDRVISRSAGRGSRARRAGPRSGPRW